MHELALTENILSIALEQAKAVQAQRITKINLIIGELSGFVAECIQFNFEFLSQDSIAAQAVLTFTPLPTSLRCRNCATIFTPKQPLWVCPSCQGQSVEIVSGRECYVESIEVE